MKTIWTVLSVFLIVHVLAAAIGLAWLWQSGRLDRQRLLAVRDVFRYTIEQEGQQAEQADALAEEAEAKQSQLAWLRDLEAGPSSVEMRVAAEQQAREVALVRMERYRQDVVTLSETIEQGKRFLSSERQQIEAERVDHNSRLQERQDQQRDTDFRMAVRMLERVPAKQAKQMFGQLIRDGRKTQVVDYLAAMNTRKAAAVLGQFKQPNEIAQVTALVEQLRQRGVDTSRMRPEGKDS